MPERRNPRVGVVSDSNLQRLALAQAVKGHGYDLCINTSPDKLDESALDSAELDVWVVDMQDEDDEFLDRLLESPTLTSKSSPASRPIGVMTAAVPQANTSETWPLLIWATPISRTRITLKPRLHSRNICHETPATNTLPPRR